MKTYLIILMLLFASFYNLAQSNDSIPIHPLAQRAFALDSMIRNNPNLQTTNFNPQDTTSLPIGIVRPIGESFFIICIDSAFFTPTGAYFNAYMALDFPNSSERIAFAAKGIQFNPKGVLVSNGARLQLVTEQTINLGPSLQAVFKDDGMNFIEWDCSGYKQAGLSIDFVLNGEMVTHAINPNEHVKAHMQMVVADLNNIVFQLNQMDPFKVKGLDDFVFSLSNITLDRSELQTPSGVNLPSQVLATYGGDLNLWKGFHAQNATITLPEKLSQSNGETQIYANNLIIDDRGVSGDFGANNLFSTNQGAIGDSTNQQGKWGFSLSNLQVSVVSNHLTSGSLSGDVVVAPLDDKSFNYSATISEVPNQPYLDYNFTISPGNDSISINAFKSKLVLNPTSTITIASVGRTFVPTAVLNGSWTLNESRAKMKGINFQQLTLTTQAPYITSGIFSLVSNNESNCVGLPISLTTVGMYVNTQNQLQFTAGIAMSLGGAANEPAFGVETTLRVNTARQVDNFGKERITFNNLAVDDILIDVVTSPFEMHGVIAIRANDPVFGKLFYGALSLQLKNFMESPMMVSAGFGKKDGNKYWFTEAALPTDMLVPSGPGIAVGPSIYISSLYGGVQKGVSSNLTEQQLLSRVSGNINNSSSSAIPFIPDPNMGLTFRAGVGLIGQQEKQLNGEVMLTVAFNANGGFQSIDFIGQAYMLVTRDKRNNPNSEKVYGALSVSYDNAQKTFDAQLQAQIFVPSMLTGGLDVKLHIDPNDWYFWLNRPANRAYLNFVNVFNVDAYFMIGTQIDPIPAPPSYVTNLTGGGSIGNIDLSAVGNGSGFATGMSFNVNAGGEFPSNTKWRGFISVNVGGGFDVIMFDAQNAHCSGSSAPIGVNGYYIMGQVYAYLGGSLGARKYKDNGEIVEYNLGSLAVAALLQGKLPKPTFVYGAVGVEVEILGIVNFGFNAEVELGNNCSIVGI